MPLNIEPNLASPDAFYQTLIETHQGLSDEQSAEMNAALVLLLANHIGDMEIIHDALARARRAILP
ncbi:MULTISPECIES: DUF2783 domain-containing protein [unclassified Bordetella]|uniref:DUF2783 domain-containing protein n=1 Tax=unclassified Bordetella TaxID=2630031 RepID=UPI001321123D|nr:MULTISPECIES: DUF2783 domain-containing protein [unclassified Bordetella]MVW70210.1 DUF2783 domain-containing protein [Bordetella sp. 15P40C-2]MVW77963.1 DUF2783 domain-containing protein [Bordetella sp. 02P26C-1]